MSSEFVKITEIKVKWFVDEKGKALEEKWVVWLK